MQFVPFQETTNENLDSVYIFKIKNNSENNPKIYTQEITIDGLNDSLLLSATCTCKGYMFKKVRCKHIKLCLEELKNWKIDYREEKNAI